MRVWEGRGQGCAATQRLWSLGVAQRTEEIVGVAAAQLEGEGPHQRQDDAHRPKRGTTRVRDDLPRGRGAWEGWR